MASKEKCFTFTWKLENISYCLEGKDEAIYSPDFVLDSIDETKWCLGLYPRGKDDGNHIGFYLFRDEDSKGAARVEIKYEPAFIAEDGSVLKSYGALKTDFPKNTGRGFPQFETLKDVFVTKRSTFLPQDTLIARCKIWKSDGEMAEDVRCFARTRIGVQKRSFLWNVNNFSTLEPVKKYTYQIKSIERDSPLMSIDLSLSLGLTSKETICFELTLQDQTKTFSTLRLSLIDASGNIVECNQEEFWYEDPSKSQEFKFFFTKNKLMAMENSYLPDDILSLHWEWTFSEGVVSERIEEVQYAFLNSESKFSNAENINNKNMISLSYTLNDSLKSLYDESFLCDVKLMTKTCTFNAHKIILSASSSVFKAMFSSDMKEKDSNFVNIEDLSDDTISRMLVYVYAARIEDLTWERASHLYVAADKYAILGLKNICSSYLKDNLSPSNACEVLLLSDFHSDVDLKSAVQNYILNNIKYVVNCDEWKLLMETNGKLAAETVCLQYK
ncbi:Speckle-type POZ protein B [Araneus ventricosus]|uniref:Speckle-type POZ protein B n=1 Tax=Araneus ventricosus TaxID=182803 RepID=A0A4Y2D796_ARAVE|nr:Speckle-type POZ protein B [Araneus ventricosus]